MKILNMFLKILMVVITFVYPLFFNLLAGCSIAAAAVRADVFSFMFFTGIAMVISSVLMTSATVFVLGGKKKAAFVTDTAGILLCMTAAVVITVSAHSRGLTDDSLRPLSLVYAVRHFPSVIHYIAAAVLFFTDYIRDKREDSRKLHEFVYANSGIDEVMNMPDDDI